MMAELKKLKNKLTTSEKRNKQRITKKQENT